MTLLALSLTRNRVLRIKKKVINLMILEQEIAEKGHDELKNTYSKIVKSMMRLKNYTL